VDTYSFRSQTGNNNAFFSCRTQMCVSAYLDYGWLNIYYSEKHFGQKFCRAHVSYGTQFFFSYIRIFEPINLKVCLCCVMSQVDMVRVILKECNKMDNVSVPPFCFTVFKLFESVKGQHSRTASTDMNTDPLKMLGYAYI